MPTETLGELLSRNPHGDAALQGSEALYVWDDGEAKGVTVENFANNLPTLAVDQDLISTDPDNDEIIFRDTARLVWGEVPDELDTYRFFNARNNVSSQTTYTAPGDLDRDGSFGAYPTHASYNSGVYLDVSKDFSNALQLYNYSADIKLDGRDAASPADLSGGNVVGTYNRIRTQDVTNVSVWGFGGSAEAHNESSLPLIQGGWTFARVQDNAHAQEIIAVTAELEVLDNATADTAIGLGLITSIDTPANATSLYGIKDQSSTYRHNHLNGSLSVGTDVNDTHNPPAGFLVQVPASQDTVVEHRDENGDAVKSVAKNGRETSTRYPSVARVELAAQVDVNTIDWTVIPWDATTLDDDLYTVSLPAITVDTAGTYRVMGHLSFSSNTERVSPALRFTVNGTATNPVSRSGYIRVNSGHTKASTSLRDTVELSAGDTLRAESIADANTGVADSIPNESFLLIELLSFT